MKPITSVCMACILLAGCACAPTPSPATPPAQKTSENQSDTPSSQAEEPADFPAADEGKVTEKTEETNPSEAEEDVSAILPEESAKQGLETLALDVPYRTQENGYYCVPAALQSVLLYHGISKEQEELADLLHTSSVTGTEYADLAAVATKLIFPDGQGAYAAVKDFTDQEKDTFTYRLLADMQTRDPVFVSINNKVLYQDVGDQVHMLVITGISYDKDTGSIQSVQFLDPSYTRRMERNNQVRTCSFDTLWQAMTDNPEPGYVY